MLLHQKLGNYTSYYMKNQALSALALCEAEGVVFGLNDWAMAGL